MYLVQIRDKLADEKGNEILDSIKSENFWTS